MASGVGLVQLANKRYQVTVCVIGGNRFFSITLRWLCNILLTISSPRSVGHTKTTSPKIYFRFFMTSKLLLLL